MCSASAHTAEPARLRSEPLFAGRPASVVIDMESTRGVRSGRRARIKITTLALVIAFAARNPIGTCLVAASAGEPGQYTTHTQDGTYTQDGTHTQGGPCSVPRVVGLDRAAAERRLGQSELAPGRVETRSAAEPAGTVLAQRPGACSNYPEGGRVDLVVSSGPAATETPQERKHDGPSVGDVAVPVAIGVGIAVLGGILAKRNNGVEVPDLSRNAIAIAEQTLKKRRLRLGEVVSGESLTAPAGTVIEQSPVAGTRVQRDSVVNVRVSSGRPMTEVPDLALKGWREAEALVTGARLRMLTTNPPASDEPGLIVESQVPAAGTRVIVGASVGVTLRNQARTAIFDTPSPAIPPTARTTPNVVPPTEPPAAQRNPAAAPAAPRTPAPPRASAPPPTAPTVPAAAPIVPAAVPTIPAAVPTVANPAAPPVAPVAPNPAAAVVPPQIPPALPVSLLVLDSAWPWLWVLLLFAAVLFGVKRIRTRGARPKATDVPPVVPHITFVPRLDTGRQVVITTDDRANPDFELALHIDAGYQQFRCVDPPRIITHIGARS